MTFYATHGVSVAAQTTGAGPVESLNAQSATTATSVVFDAGTVRPNAVLVVTTSAGVSAGDVELQASMDGVNFWTVGSPLAVSAANTTYQQVSTSAYGRYFRAVISTAIVGGTITAWVAASG